MTGFGSRVDGLALFQLMRFLLIPLTYAVPAIQSVEDPGAIAATAELLERTVLTACALGAPSATTPEVPCWRVTR